MSNPVRLPKMFVVSDGTGITGRNLVQAAAAQFINHNPEIEILSHAENIGQIKSFLIRQSEDQMAETGDPNILVFITLVDAELRRQMLAYVDEDPFVECVDLLTSSVKAISDMTDLQPNMEKNTMRRVDSEYFRRVDAMEFTIAHDGGNRPEDLTKADIVLIGVSRTSKTPLSIYLSQQGYKVANILLGAEIEPPAQLFDVDPTRVFGLMTTPEVLAPIRQQRLDSSADAVDRYADLEFIYDDLEQALSLMRRLGCVVVHTENRAVEETAQEILKYYTRAHG